MSWSPGAQIDRYILGEQLGAGAMGAVFLASDADTGHRYAIKALAFEATPRAIARFQREGQAQAAADGHPNVARVRGTGEAHGHYYLVMDLLTGGDLQKRLRRGSLVAEEAAEIVAGLAHGIAHVHQNGVLHRDLKPANVMFDEEGVPKLVDFGIARLKGAEGLTKTGDVVGTPAYMAPEQVDSARDVDERADVYGLGAILYHCLTGQQPFDGDVASVIKRVLIDPPAAPRSLDDSIPPELERVCLQALAKDPKDRYRDAEALAADLERFLRGEEVLARVPVRWNRLLVPLMVLSLLLVAGLVVVVVKVRGMGGSDGDDRLSDQPNLSITLIDAPTQIEARHVDLTGKASGDVRKIEVRVGAVRLPIVRPTDGVFTFPLNLPIGTSVIELLPRGKREIAGEAFRHTIQRGWTGAQVESPKDPSLKMIRIKAPGRAAPFTIGCNTRPPWWPEKDEFETHLHPERQVVLTQDYYVGETEVTWAQYVRFCSATNRAVPTTTVLDRKTKKPAFAPDLKAAADLPVYNVSYSDAIAYCRWAGLRLLTEAEWEYAGRGPKGRTFPWGETIVRDLKRNAYTVNLTNSAEQGISFDPDPFPCKAGKWPAGASDFGILGLAGNVREWVHGWYGPYPEGLLVDPQGPTRGSERILRGGYFDRGLHRATLWWREPHADRASYYNGFRVAHDAD